MMRRSLPVALALLAIASPAFGQSDSYTPGVWHFRSIPCVDTTVTSVAPRLLSLGQKTFSAKDFQMTGVSVTFATTLGSDPALPPMRVTVTHYQDNSENKIMQAEHIGDKVQVCFLGPPAPTVGCDPDKDPRGRTYRIYDYRQRAQYSGGSQHGCGGA
jgi:hypothetical protein